MSFYRKLWIGLNIVIYLVAIGTWIAIPEHYILNSSIMGLGMVLSGILIYPARHEFYQSVTSRFSRKMYNNMINLFLVFCIISLVQYLAYKNSTFFDLTSQKVNSLSEQTKEVLNSMPGEIGFTYYGERDMWNRKLPLMQLYKNLKKDIKIKAVDIEAQPQLVRANNIEKGDTLQITYKGKGLNVETKSELTITNGLLKLIRNREIKIYATSGHGEIDIDDESREGGNKLAEYIRNTSYQLEKLDIVNSGIPFDAFALMILGPKKSFLKGELNKIRAFIEKGGKLLVTLGPNFKSNPNKELIKLLSEYGIKVNNNIIVDMLSQKFNTDATVPFITTYDPSHTITKNFAGRAIFPIVSSVEAVGKTDYNVSLLAFSNNFPASWAESNLKDVEKGIAKFDRKDKKGPQAVLAVSEKESNRVAVFGNSAFIINGYEMIGTNFNLFLNTLSWLVDDKPIISLNRPQVNNQTILMSANQVHLIFYFSVIFAPLILFGFAFFQYKRRQKL
jgi:ABC-type uncharacterized transport system involved in gliding motility auxiliary subunit